MCQINGKLQKDKSSAGQVETFSGLVQFGASVIYLTVKQTLSGKSLAIEAVTKIKKLHLKDTYFLPYSKSLDKFCGIIEIGGQEFFIALKRNNLKDKKSFMSFVAIDEF